MNIYRIFLVLLLGSSNIFGQEKSASHAELTKKLEHLLEQHSKMLLSGNECPQNLGSEIDTIIASFKNSDDKYSLLKTTFSNQAFAKFGINVFPREEQVSAPAPYQRWWISARIGKCLVDIHRLQNHEYIALEHMHLMYRNV